MDIDMASPNKPIKDEKKDSHSCINGIMITSNNRCVIMLLSHNDNVQIAFVINERSGFALIFHCCFVISKLIVDVHVNQIIHKETIYSFLM